MPLNYAGPYQPPIGGGLMQTQPIQGGGLINTASNYQYPLTSGLLNSFSQGMPSNFPPQSQGIPDYTQMALQMAGNPHAGPYAAVPLPSGLGIPGGPPSGTTGNGGSAALGLLGALAHNPGLVKSVGSSIGGLFGNGLPAGAAAADVAAGDAAAAAPAVTSDIAAAATDPAALAITGGADAAATGAAGAADAATTGLAGAGTADAAGAGAAASGLGLTAGLLGGAGIVGLPFLMSALFPNHPITEAQYANMSPAQQAMSFDPYSNPLSPRQAAYMNAVNSAPAGTKGFAGVGANGLPTWSNTFLPLGAGTAPMTRPPGV